jgi:hypothetical protein
MNIKYKVVQLSKTGSLLIPTLQVVVIIFPTLQAVILFFQLFKLYINHSDCVVCVDFYESFFQICREVADHFDELLARLS